MGVSEVLLGAKVPMAGDADQEHDTALPDKTPAKVTELFWQLVWSMPAFTIGAWFTVRIIRSFTARQGPAPSGSLLVSVS